MDWLKLHYAFGCLELAFCFFIMILLGISFKSIVEPMGNLDTNLFCLIWYFAFMAGVFPYFHRIKNTLGMEYKKIESGSFIGASAYAELAKIKFEFEEKKGISYLLTSLNMLRYHLAYYDKQLSNLDRTISALSTIRRYTQNIPYDQLFFLAQELRHIPNLEKIPEALTSFLESQEVKWSQGFLATSRSERRERIRPMLEKYIIPVALLLITLFGAFPETTRMQILNIIEKIQWSQFAGFCVVVFLFYYVFAFIIRIDKDLEYNDIRKLTS